MATRQETESQILDQMAKLVPDADNTATTLMILQLAEAWAWLHNPSQPHGGSAADG